MLALIHYIYVHTTIDIEVDKCLGEIKLIIHFTGMPGILINYNRSKTIGEIVKKTFRFGIFSFFSLRNLTFVNPIQFDIHSVWLDCSSLI